MRRRRKNTMSEVKTFVYFDLEATGLRSSGRPRITELSFVAVNTKDVLALHSKLLTHLQRSQTDVESILPRIMNKLTVCVYIQWISQDLKTGELLNSLLAHFFLLFVWWQI